MVITLHSTVHDAGIPLFADSFLGDFDVKPVGETPHGRINLAKFHGRLCIILDRFLEAVVKVPVVQEHVRIIPEAIEVALDGFHRIENSWELLVSGQDDEGCVCPGARGVDFEASRGEDLVMFLADFPVVK